MMIRMNWLPTICASSLLLLAACGGGGGAATTSEPAAATSGGEPAIVVTDSAEWQSLSASGKTSFDTACGSCHPGGDADLGPSLKEESHSVAAMTKQIREGSGRMKPVDTATLPEDQMKGLMVYLSSLGAVSDVKGP
ncbi:MAG: cytochrome c [Myxococcales bacterium]